LTQTQFRYWPKAPKYHCASEQLANFYDFNSKHNPIREELNFGFVPSTTTSIKPFQILSYSTDGNTFLIDVLK